MTPQQALRQAHKLGTKTIFPTRIQKQKIIRCIQKCKGSMTCFANLESCNCTNINCSGAIIA